MGGCSATCPAIRACSRARSDEDEEDEEACACLFIKMVGPLLLLGGRVPCVYKVSC